MPEHIKLDYLRHVLLLLQHNMVWLVALLPKYCYVHVSLCVVKSHATETMAVRLPSAGWVQQLDIYSFSTQSSI